MSLGVVVSTAEVPGEGEHKLAEFIRVTKSCRAKQMKARELPRRAKWQELDHEEQGMWISGNHVSRFPPPVEHAPNYEVDDEDREHSHCIYGLDADLIMLAFTDCE